MAVTKRYDYRITFADGRVLEISSCATVGLARLLASDYHRAGGPATPIAKVVRLQPTSPARMPREGQRGRAPAPSDRVSVL
jgi:hypothetical protein